MFERFTEDARQAVVLAQEEAVALHHGWIGTEHLLLGVLRADGDGARLLAGFGVDAAGVRDDVVRIVGRGEDDIDRDALATLGIDLDAVRERVERAFGPGALIRRRRCRRGGIGRHGPVHGARQEGARAHPARGDQPRRARPARRAPRPRARCARATASRRASCAERGVDPRRGARAHAPAATRPERDAVRCSGADATFGTLGRDVPSRHRHLHRAGARALERLGPAGLPAAALLRRRRPARGRDRAPAAARRDAPRRSRRGPRPARRAHPGRRRRHRPGDLRGRRPTRRRAARCPSATTSRSRSPAARSSATSRCWASAAGMQLMNVAARRHALQHLPESHGHHEHRRDPGSFDGADHDVRLDRRLARRPRRGRGRPRHEVPPPPGASTRVGEGFEVTGWSSSTSCPRPSRHPTRRFALGVQWHPEADETSRLIGALVAEAAAARNGRR